MAQTNLSTLFDKSVDESAVLAESGVYARLWITIVAAGMLAGNLGLAVAGKWLAVTIVAELWGRASISGRSGQPASTVAARVQYVLSGVLLTGNWTAISILYWSTDLPGLRFAAVVALTGQLIHAQAFSYQSLPVLLANAVLPATGLLVLPIFFGGFSGFELVTVICGVLLPLCYIFSSARANIVSARELRQAQSELEKLAYLDALTMLGNRRMFADNYRKLIAYSTRQGTRFALLLIDLDRFKSINDAFGHAAGDALLVEVGVRLLRAVRDGDHVARTGGDEFAILLAGADDPLAIEAICQRIADSFIEAIEFGGVPMKASLSVGVAVFPEDGTNADGLLKSADVALYDAKRGGRSTWRYHGQAAEAAA